MLSETPSAARATNPRCCDATIRSPGKVYDVILEFTNLEQLGLEDATMQSFEVPNHSHPASSTNRSHAENQHFRRHPAFF